MNYNLFVLVRVDQPIHFLNCMRSPIFELIFIYIAAQQHEALLLLIEFQFTLDLQIKKIKFCFCDLKILFDN